MGKLLARQVIRAGLLDAQPPTTLQLRTDISCFRHITTKCSSSHYLLTSLCVSHRTLLLPVDSAWFFLALSWGCTRSALRNDTPRRSPLFHRRSMYFRLHIGRADRKTAVTVVCCLTLPHIATTGGRCSGETYGAVPSCTDDSGSRSPTTSA